MKKALLLLLVLTGCKGGLPLDEGNAYFCEPTASGDRNAQDAQCPPGWVCGVTGRCQPEIKDIVPLDGTQVVFANDTAPRAYPPDALAGPYRDVASAGVEAAEVMVVPVGAGGFSIVSRSSVTSEPLDAGNAELLELAYSPDNLAAIVTTTVTGTAAADVRREVLLVRRSDRQAELVLNPPGPANTLDDAWALRSISEKDGGYTLYVQRQPTEVNLASEHAGEVDFSGAPTFRPFLITSPDGGVLELALDARPVPRAIFERLDAGNQTFTPLVLTKSGFHYRRNRGLLPTNDNWIDLTSPGESEIPLAFSVEHDPPTLRVDPTMTVFAVSFARSIQVNDEMDRRHTSLSTWRFERTPSGGTASRSWGDCRPCGPNGYIGLMTPVLRNGVPVVDVVCDIEQSPGSFTSKLIRVSGSNGNDVTDSCATTTLSATVDAREVVPNVVNMTRPKPDGTAVVKPARVYANADYLGGGLVIGGAHGQIWRGRALDDLHPMFLDRVPDDVSTMLGHPFALTPHYAASSTPVGLAVVDDSIYKTQSNDPVLPRSAPSDTSSQSAGWVVLQGGELAKLTPDAGNILVEFGSPLVSAAGEQAPEPYYVEKVQYFGKTHFIIGAFDSLYVSSNQVTPLRGQLPPLSPVLTPQPGAAIRSFVMDRADDFVSSQFGDEKGNLPVAHGYLIAGATLFHVSMTSPTGSSERWVSQPFDLGGGEPISVFMREDPDPDGFGRVGMRDGRIFSLPSLNRLMSDLGAAVDPSVDGGSQSLNALSFASFDRLPVMLTEDTLWSPRYVSGRTTYQWTGHALPKELTAGDLAERRRRMANARLHAGVEGDTQVLYLFTDFGFVYKLATAPVAP